MAREKPAKILEPRRKFDYSADSNIFYDLVVVGSGVAGLACGMYAGRLGLKVLIVGELQGGTITLTESVENYPGFISIEGSELGRLMENHVKDYDVDILSGRVDRVEMHQKEKKRHFATFASGEKYFSKAIVFAMGTEVRKLGVPGEKEFKGKGVSYCALCDGPLFKGKVIGIVGGGNSAVKEALLLAKYGARVVVFYRGEKIVVERENMLKLDEAVKSGKIEVVGNVNVVEIKGDFFVKSVVLDREVNGSKEFNLDGLFVYIGNIPLSKLAGNLDVGLGKSEGIVINGNSETNLEGVYAAGDVTDSKWKQAIIGVAEGVKAAFYAYEYVGDGTGVLELDVKEVEKNV